jgi:hypothetical protein
MLSGDGGSHVARKPLFVGLLFNEKGEPLDGVIVGNEPFYVVPDDGFRRHVEARSVDLQILQRMRDLILPHKEIVTQQILAALGKDDLFAKVMVDSALQNMDKQVDLMEEQGLPEEAKMWLGFMGFRATVNVHGEVVDLKLPAQEAPDDDDE